MGSDRNESSVLLYNQHGICYLSSYHVLFVKEGGEISLSLAHSLVVKVDYVILTTTLGALS